MSEGKTKEIKIKDASVKNKQEETVESENNVFQKALDVIKTHKTVAIICVAVLLVGVISIIAVSNSMKGEKKKDSTPEEKITESLKDMAKHFYEDYYYVNAGGSSDESKAEYFAKYSSIGLKVSLDNLVRYSGVNMDDYISDYNINDSDEVKLKQCKDNTKVKIYPKDPYGKTDYEMEVEVECEFK